MVLGEREGQRAARQREAEQMSSKIYCSFPKSQQQANASRRAQGADDAEDVENKSGVGVEERESGAARGTGNKGTSSATTTGRDAGKARHDADKRRRGSKEDGEDG
jgi:hypothetical protein